VSLPQAFEIGFLNQATDLERKGLALSETQLQTYSWSALISLSYCKDVSYNVNSCSSWCIRTGRSRSFTLSIPPCLTGLSCFIKYFNC
jgi:hypothetical protein